MRVAFCLLLLFVLLVGSDGSTAGKEVISKTNVTDEFAKMEALKRAALGDDFCDEVMLRKIEEELRSIHPRDFQHLRMLRLLLFGPPGNFGSIGVEPKDTPPPPQFLEYSMGLSYIPPEDTKNRERLRVFKREQEERRRQEDEEWSRRLRKPL